MVRLIIYQFVPSTVIMLYIPNLFEPVKKILKWQKIAIDNFVFQLHYKLTVIQFLVMAVMVTAKAHFGDPIDCSFDTYAAIPVKLLNNLCWLHGTYTRIFSNKTEELRCIEKFKSAEECSLGDTQDNNYSELHHAYYQWICWVIFFQVLLFLIPRQMWKMYENNKVKMIVGDCCSTPAFDEEDQNKRIKGVHGRYEKFRGKNNGYAYFFFFCEMLNMVVCIVNIWLVNTLFHGRFIHYGWNVLQDYLGGEDDKTLKTMDIVFPKVSQCKTTRRNHDGKIMEHASKCLLTTNIINDKVYLWMWYWLILLLCASILNLIYRVTCLMNPDIRFLVLRRKLDRTSDGYKYHEVVKNVEKVGNSMEIGDWFILRQISKNIDDITFVKLMEHICLDEKCFRDQPYGIKMKEIPKKMKELALHVHSVQKDQYPLQKKENFDSLEDSGVSVEDESVDNIFGRKNNNPNQSTTPSNMKPFSATPKVPMLSQNLLAIHKTSKTAESESITGSNLDLPSHPLDLEARYTGDQMVQHDEPLHVEVDADGSPPSRSSDIGDSEADTPVTPTSPRSSGFPSKPQLLKGYDENPLAISLQSDNQ